MEQLSHTIGFAVERAVSSVLSLLAKLPGSTLVGRYIALSHQNDPQRTVFEILLALFALHYFLASKQSYAKQDYVALSEEEVDELVKEWEPEPLVDEAGIDDEAYISEIPILESENSAHVIDNGQKLMNLGCHDLYGCSVDPELQEISLETIRRCGVGSCGPAGFYGNEDVHIRCEKDVGEFLGTEGVILYSQGFSTATSVIPCFAKRGDILVVDQAVNMSIQRGLQLSRAKIIWFKHNDTEDLELKLKTAVSMHRRGPVPRRFIVTEGLFEYTANSPDLAEVVRLKKLYKFRLILDESWSLGTLGKHGRGLPEDKGVPRSDIDITVASLANAIGSGGGICAGSEMMVEHQRIVSLAYTFSATELPYLASMTSAFLKRLETDKFAEEHIAPLRSKAASFTQHLKKCKEIDVLSRPDSMYIVFSLALEFENERDLCLVIHDIIMRCRERGVLITRLRQVAEYETFAPVNAIRICIHEGLSAAELKQAAEVLVKSIKESLR